MLHAQENWEKTVFAFGMHGVFYGTQGVDVFSQWDCCPLSAARTYSMGEPHRTMHSCPQQLLEHSLLEPEARGPWLIKCGRGHQLPWTAQWDVTPLSQPAMGSCWE